MSDPRRANRDAVAPDGGCMWPSGLRWIASLTEEGTLAESPDLCTHHLHIAPWTQGMQDNVVAQSDPERAQELMSSRRQASGAQQQTQHCTDRAVWRPALRNTATNQRICPKALRARALRPGPLPPRCATDTHLRDGHCASEALTRQSSPNNQQKHLYQHRGRHAVGLPLHTHTGTPACPSGANPDSKYNNTTTATTTATPPPCHGRTLGHMPML